MLIRTDASRELLDSGRLHLLSYRMSEAERDFRRLANRPDGRPAAYFFLSSAALHRALMTDEQVHYRTYSERSDSLRSILKALDASPWRDFMISETDLYDAIADTKQNRYVRAAWSARSAYIGYSRLVRSFPEFDDAYKGLGMLHLAIGTMPSTYRFILRILGFDGKVRVALQELERAHRRSEIGREEASIYLALTHTMFFIDEEEALQIMKGLHGDHPESVVMSHLYGYVLLTNRQVQEAEAMLRGAIERAESGRYFYVDYLDFYLAESLFRQDRFREAESYYLRYIDRHKGPALKALAYLGLGLSIEMQGRRSDAVSHYQKVRAARDFDTDAAARRWAQRLASAPMSALDRELLKGRNAYDSGRYAAALAGLGKLVDNARSTASQKAEAAYRMGRVYHAMKRYEDAVTWYERGIEWTVDRLDRWAPWGRFFIGQVREEQGRTAEAREAYKQALGYGGKYDYFQALEQSARVALELIE
ncbi:MAG: tetratricopeptide repeat protein [Rhodothermales bacterium]